MFLFEELSPLAIPRSLGAAPALQVPLPSLCPCACAGCRACIPAGRMDAERVTAGTLEGRGYGDGRCLGQAPRHLFCTSSDALAKRGMWNNNSNDAKQLSVPVLPSDGGIQVFSPKVQKLKVSRGLEPRNSWFSNPSRALWASQHSSPCGISHFPFVSGRFKSLGKERKRKNRFM